MVLPRPHRRTARVRRAPRRNGPQSHDAAHEAAPRLRLPLWTRGGMIRGGWGRTRTTARPPPGTADRPMESGRPVRSAGGLPAAGHRLSPGARRDAAARRLELSDLCGLPARQLTRFRAGRLVVHEVLIRVMSDLSVPVGAVYADLGVNFRAIVATILREGVEPRLGEVEAALRDDPRRGRRGARPRGRRHPGRPAGDPPAGTGLARPAPRARVPGPSSAPREDRATRALRHLETWQRRAAESGDGLEIAACEALRCRGVGPHRPAEHPGP